MAFRRSLLGIWLPLLVLRVWLSWREAGETQKAASKCFCVCRGTCVHEIQAAFSSSSSVQRCRPFNTGFHIKMAERAVLGEGWALSFSSCFLKLHHLLSTQAATQARTEETNTTDASWRKRLEQRIRALESELETARSMQEENTLQLARAQAEVESSEKRYLVDLEMRRCPTKDFQK